MAQFGWPKTCAIAFRAATSICLMLVASPAFAADSVLKSLQPRHPRIYLAADDWESLKQRLEQPPLNAWYASLQSKAAKMLVEPPVEHVLIGPRLLDKSKTALLRISTLAGLYRLDGDKKKLERAKKELLTVCAFADWNPSHFLDVAEMTHGVALGYDWLYQDLSESERATIRKAIVEKGLKPGLKAFEKGDFWTKCNHNWSQVCNGGLTVGALAVAEDEREIAEQIIGKGRTSIEIPMHSFGPDGGWAEGPGYWNYATSYNVFYLAAIKSALGTDFGLPKAPGFAETGLFRIHSIGPINQTFNYADAHEGPGTSPQMFWLAKQFHHPEFIDEERRLSDKKPDIFHLLWADALQGESSSGKSTDSLPPDALFRGVNVAFLRSEWNNSKALYVGFKGGDNKANHSHLDLGTFVFDALGQRWAMDLGPDDYNLPAYFGAKRWTYYRLKTEGHNTLTIDGENQSATAKSPIVAFNSGKDRSMAVADLSAAYAPKTTRVRRGIAMLEKKCLVVQDEVDAPQAVDVVWNFHTQAKIDLHGASATLTLGGETLEAKILSPANARFSSILSQGEPPQKQTPDAHNLVIRLPSKVKQTRIVVQLLPAGSEKTVYKMEPLEKWIAAGKLEK